MLIFPAIDIMEGQAVRLLRGDYEKKTVFHNDPVQVALRFQEQGASYLHVVDLEGAKNGGTPNLHVIRSIVSGTDLITQVGGGIRSMETVKAYLDSMAEAKISQSGVPAWYAILDRDGKIIAGLGVIENDFHKRPDLAPNICAVYVEEGWRKQGLARLLLNHVCGELAGSCGKTSKSAPVASGREIAFTSPYR